MCGVSHFILFSFGDNEYGGWSYGLDVDGS